jgi:hypothetical protein
MVDGESKRRGDVMAKLTEQMLDVELEGLMKTDSFRREDYENIIRARQLSRTLPFDLRNEISADARYMADRIVRNMWIIGVGLPIVASLLLILFTSK